MQTEFIARENIQVNSAFYFIIHVAFTTGGCGQCDPIRLSLLCLSSIQSNANISAHHILKSLSCSCLKTPD